MPDLEPGSLDYLIFGDVLEHLILPFEIIARLRKLLKPGSWAVASIPNMGHHSVINALLQGDWQYQPNGLFDATHLRFFTFSSALKLFLDAGFTAEIVDTIEVPASPQWHQAIQPMVPLVGTVQNRLRYSADAYQFILRGRTLPEFIDDQSSSKITLSVCVSRPDVLQANLLASPELQEGSQHTKMLWSNVPSAAVAHNQALDQADTDWVVCVHQDVYLPQGWIKRFLKRVNEAEAALGRLSVVGVYGIADQVELLTRAGHVLERNLHSGNPSVETRAAIAIFELAMIGTQLLDMDERIAKLEAIHADQASKQLVG